MPQHDFKAIEAQVFGLGMGLVDGKQVNETLHRLLPRQEDRDAFWANVRIERDTWLWDCRSPRITAQDLIDTIDNERLLSRNIFEPLLPKLEHMAVPWLPIGTDPTRTIIYRLAPDPFGLRAQNENPPQTDREILPSCFLGISEEVQPRQKALPLSRRKANPSETSTESVELDDNPPGIIFFQLGRLECLGVTHDDDTAMQRLDAADWEDTGFALVVRLSAGGSADGIYAVADTFPYNEETCEREQVVGPNWGIPPHPKGAQFSCARVARRLGDLGFDTVLEWTEIIDHPVELVWLMLTADARAIGATVVDPREVAR